MDQNDSALNSPTSMVVLPSSQNTQGYLLNGNQVPNGMITPLMLAATATIANGDTYYSNGSVFVRLPAGTEGQVATITSGVPSWETISVPTVPTDGWTTVTDTFTYASASSFTIAGVNRTTVYTKGTRIKFTNNSTTYYGVVGSSSFSTNTTVNLIANTDFTIANSAITNPFYSYQINPQGYPSSFNYTPTLAAGGSMTYGTTTVNYAKFYVIGNLLSFEVDATGTTGGSADSRITFSLPITIISAYSSTDNLPAAAASVNDSGHKAAMLIFVSTSILGVQKYDASNWGIGSGRAISAAGFYQF